MLPQPRQAHEDPEAGKEMGEEDEHQCQVEGLDQFLDDVLVDQIGGSLDDPFGNIFLVELVSPRSNQPQEYVVRIEKVVWKDCDEIGGEGALQVLDGHFSWLVDLRDVDYLYFDKVQENVDGLDHYYNVVYVTMVEVVLIIADLIIVVANHQTCDDYIDIKGKRHDQVEGSQLLVVGVNHVVRLDLSQAFG